MNVKGIGKTSYQKLEKHFIDFGKTEPTTNNQVKTNSDLSLININTANTEELILLPGIGPSKAQKIITKREELTQFSSLEQLLDIKGIGKNTLEKLRDKITLGAEK
ncbi:MAG: ComEA family DNA-binding protein [Candidatus Cloacimonetes bacterium]|nr:ComEA family DNA-binding protein [Candidatus Cloacimonadota bacterium]